MTHVARWGGRRRAGLVAAACVVALMAAACSGGSGGSGGGATPSGGGIVQGGELRIGTTYAIDSLNPFVAQADYAYTTFEYIYPELVQYNQKLDIVPDFAKSWTESPDGLTWTFHTQPNAKWSDGKPLTANDAAWTITTELKYIHGATAQAAGTLKHMTGADAPDPNTLVLHYSTPVANVLAQMAGESILPQQVWGKYATGNGAALRTFPNLAPVVSGGPFELVKYVKNQVALFQPNPGWWGPKPHISEFGFEFFSNADAMISAFKQGELDFIGEYTPPTAVADLKASGFVVDTYPSISMKDFIINTNSHKTKNRELLNPLVRLALAHAIDREQIVKVAWLGLAQPGDSFIAPADGMWHDPKLKPETFDLALANQELDQAGYPKGSDGVRVADGHKMSYTVIFPTDENGAGDRTFQIIQSDFRQIGVVITQKTMDDDATFAAISGPNNKYLNFDMAMWDWVPPVDPDFMLSVVTCEQYGNWSDSGYCNPSYDAMYDQQSTLINPKARQQLVWKMQDQIYNDRPYIILDYPDIIEAHSTKWAGFVPAPVMGSINSLSTQTLLQVHQVG
jgi:peptide/nickel transport system substrate-binding protein